MISHVQSLFFFPLCKEFRLLSQSRWSGDGVKVKCLSSRLEHSDIVDLHHAAIAIEGGAVGLTGPVVRKGVSVKNFKATHGMYDRKKELTNPHQQQD